MPEEFQAKKEWPDGVERVCDGSNIIFGTKRNGYLTSVAETPREVRRLMRQALNDDSIVELSHHADPEVKVYVHRDYLIAIDPRWTRVDDA